MATNETKDTENEVICLNNPKESRRQLKKNVGRLKGEKETKEIMKVLYKFHDLHKMVKYE